MHDGICITRSAPDIERQRRGGTAKTDKPQITLFSLCFGVDSVRPAQDVVLIEQLCSRCS